MNTHDEVTNSELSRGLSRIESKLDKVSEDHEQRLRRTERVLYVALGLGSAGAASGLSSLISALGGGA